MNGWWLCSWCPLTGWARLAALLPPWVWLLPPLPLVWYEGMDISDGIFLPTVGACPRCLPCGPFAGAGTGPGGGTGWGGGPPWFIRAGICPGGGGGIIRFPPCGPWGGGGTIAVAGSSPGEGSLWGGSPCMEWGICGGCTPPIPPNAPAIGVLKFPGDCWGGCWGGGGGSGTVSVQKQIFMYKCHLFNAQIVTFQMILW